MSKQIEKKILSEYFVKIASGHKKFEIRKDEDDIQESDMLVLKEWYPSTKTFTGRYIVCYVTDVLRNAPEYGLMDGYCIISIKPTHVYWPVDGEAYFGWAKIYDGGKVTSYYSCTRCGGASKKPLDMCPYCGAKMLNYKEML